MNSTITEDDKYLVVKHYHPPFWQTEILIQVQHSTAVVESGVVGNPKRWEGIPFPNLAAPWITPNDEGRDTADTSVEIPTGDAETHSADENSYYRGPSTMKKMITCRM